MSFLTTLLTEFKSPRTTKLNGLKGKFTFYFIKIHTPVIKIHILITKRSWGMEMKQVDFLSNVYYKKYKQQKYIHTFH